MWPDSNEDDNLGNKTAKKGPKIRGQVYVVSNVSRPGRIENDIEEIKEQLRKVSFDLHLAESHRNGNYSWNF